jgi:hypothetical protein
VVGNTGRTSLDGSADSVFTGPSGPWRTRLHAPEDKRWAKGIGRIESADRICDRESVVVNYRVCPRNVLRKNFVGNFVGNFVETQHLS